MSGSGPEPPERRGPPGRPARQPTWLERRREKVVEEITRNRQGEYKVPTWVLVLVLLALVGGWAAVVVLL